MKRYDLLRISDNEVEMCDLDDGKYILYEDYVRESDYVLGLLREINENLKSMEDSCPEE